MNRAPNGHGADGAKKRAAADAQAVRRIRAKSMDTSRIKLNPWFVFGGTLLALNSIYVAILRFGHGIHEKSSLLLDMIIFNVMFAPLTLGGLLGFASATSLMFFVYRGTFSAKTQFRCAVVAAIFACLGTQSSYREVIGNYLRWFGFTVVSGEIDTWMVVGLATGSLSGVLAFFAVVGFESLIQFLRRHDPASRTA